MIVTRRAVQTMGEPLCRMDITHVIRERQRRWWEPALRHQMRDDCEALDAWRPINFTIRA